MSTTTTILELEGLRARRTHESDTIEEISRRQDATSPDGGYGWIALAAAGVIAFWYVGTTYSWGVLQDALVAEGVSSPATLSFVGSLTIAFIAFLALINARLLSLTGTRKAAFLGIALFATGELLSSFLIHDIGGLFATSGVIMGVGTSLCFMVVSTIPAQYFSKKRGLANGIVYASGGLGGAIISFAMDSAIRTIGVPWSIRLLSFLTFATGLPAAWFIKDRIAITRKRFIDTSLFKDTRFLLLFLAGAVATFPLLVPPFFLPLYGRSIGLSSSATTALVAAFNFSSAIGRIVAGFACDRCGALNTLFTSLALSAISMLAIWPVSSSLGPLVVFSILNGAANGGFFALMPTVAGQVFGSARVGVAMGMLVSGWSGGYLMGAPIAGYILAAYGGEQAGFKSYRPAIYYAGGMTIAAAVLVAAVRLRISTAIKKKI